MRFLFGQFQKTLELLPSRGVQPTPRTLSALRTIAYGLGALLLVGACSGEKDSAQAADASAGKKGLELELAGNGKGGSSSSISANGCDVTTDDAVCAAQAYEGEAIPLDIYIMFDQSGSMLNDVGGLTRLDAVERATGTFLRDEASAAIRVGVGYFGFQPIGQTSCQPEDFATPSVPVTLDHEAVLRSLAEREPTGETPTGAAIRGACGYAQAWKKANVGHSVVMLLLTDGEPKAPMSCSTGACCPTLDDAVQAAADCRQGEPAIPTYVLGVGPFLDNLQQIAQAGGTEHAYLIGDQDVEQQVLRALNSIRSAASIPCELRLPEPTGGTALDYGLVNVAYQDSSCALSTIYNVPNDTSCDATAGGWYYDDPTAPTSVKLCGASCDQVSAPGGRLAFTVGCETEHLVK
ncbi:MAG TPA: vWA domain-containing protein [Polyangiaceae bacterium]|nr:vWA domain-containing protein [Polyangiaceae bacterium]